MGEGRRAGTVLLVEDDESVLRTNRRVLEHAGYAVQCAATLEEAWRFLGEQPPDVIVLDILMPDGSGIDFCEKARPLTPAPVLFLTALDERSEVLEGLRAGGSDYITKPYDVDELVARVDAQLSLARMNRVAQSRTLVRGPLVCDLVAHRAYLGGRDLLLTSKEFALLLVLARKPGCTLSPEHLYATVWNQPLVSGAATLRRHLSSLRRKLEEAGGGCTVEAVYGKGYRFEEETPSS
ncbi:response regulator transcription factor [Arabiibacter massiliensis]|uniref:response regulator transcription factor n=1 Tax=Arabiibacter massiliensis TaxID=1870985 RepID=UPI0009BA333F|nr:response regulator transcription factor [Arabiibacter massiliensis]